MSASATPVGEDGGSGSQVADPAAERDVPVADRVVTALLMVGLVVLVPIASFLGLLFSMASDGCVGDAPCSSGQIMSGVLVAAASPVLTYLVALVVVVLRVRARRRTWWVPVLALVVGAGLWFLGGVIAALGAS